jgi:hypothetical protein
MNTQTANALKMASYELDGVIADVEQFDGFDDVCLQTIKRVRNVIAEALNQPAWQGLTDDEINEILEKTPYIEYGSWIEFAQDIEQELKDKNT